MMITLLVIGYFAIALLFTYLDARYNGSDFYTLGIIWPVVVPLIAISFVFEVVSQLGERRG